MKNENVVFLLIGQRGAGKSHYGKRLMESQSDLQGISRDEILIRLFGTTSLSKYHGGHELGLYIMKRLLKRKLASSKGIKLILDCWTTDSEDRKGLIKFLKECGADRVIALYFITPLKLVNKWFWKKPKIAKISQMRELRGQGYSFFFEDDPWRDHKAFHLLAADIDSDGFDKVIRINPEKKLIMLT